LIVVWIVVYGKEFDKTTFLADRKTI